jgi:4-hydroxy-3-methylbut-2-en-1-yl diphosphate synthase IspG/GcpE
VQEVLFARRILETVGMREKAIEVVSCPTCGRTEIDLIGLANKAEEMLEPIALKRAEAGRRALKIAVMGCAVNGPGESKEADYGIAGGLGIELKTKIGNFFVEGRYYYGLSDIYKNSKTDDFGRSANQDIIIKLGYSVRIL